MKKQKIQTIYFIYFIVILAFVCLRIVSSLGAFSFIKDLTLLNFTTSLIIQVGILFALPLILHKITSKQKIKEIFTDFKFKKPSAKIVLYSFGIGVLACILNFFIAFIFQTIISLFGYEGLRSLSSSSYTYDTFFKFLMGVLCVGIMPAFCEEFLHRGFVLQGTQKHTGYKRAIIISSILFGLMHLNINQVFYAIILGLIMGFVAVASDNIWPAVILHFTNNFINVYLEFAAAKNLFLGNLNNYFIAIFSQSMGVGLIISTLIIGICVFALVYLITLLYKETRYKTLQKNFENLSMDMMSLNENNNPLTPDEVKQGFDIYYKESFKNINSAIDLMIPKTKNDKVKLSIKHNIFLIGTLVLGAIITYMTFLWGVY